MPYFKFVEPTDNGAARRWLGRRGASVQAVPLGEREGELELEGEPMQWLCWRFEGSLKLDVDLETSPSALSLSYQLFINRGDNI